LLIEGHRVPGILVSSPLGLSLVAKVVLLAVVAKCFLTGVFLAWCDHVQDFANKMQEASLQSLYLQHNYLTNSGALGVASLPPSVAVCLQYNCMVLPPQSLCPPNVDMPASRPEYQCQKASNGSPGD